jgi:hypothetical protein
VHSGTRCATRRERSHALRWSPAWRLPATSGAVDLRVAVLAGVAVADASPSVRDARMGVQHAEDDLAASKQARTRANAEAIPRYRDRVEAAAKPVVFHEAEPVIRTLAKDIAGLRVS